MKAKKVNTAAVGTCVSAGCNRPIQNKKRQSCSRCAAWLRFWDGRPKVDRFDRYVQLQFWQKRASGQWGYK